MTPRAHHAEPEAANFDPAPRLETVAASLALPRDGIEAAFLAVGAGLGDASTRLDRIVAAFEALPRDLESPAMTEAVERLGNFTAHARGMAEAFSTERDDVGRLADAVDAATSPIADLRRSVKMMGILSVNARIVAAGLNGDADHFGVFTTDIANLADSAAKAIAAFAEGHQRLARAVDGAADQFTAFEGTHRDILLHLADSLDAGLADVTARRAVSASRSTETVRISREIAVRLANAVMALQVGNSTRQRVEHEERALGAVAGWLRGEDALGCSVDAPRRAALLPLALELAAAQLEATVASFSHEIVEAETALLELATDADSGVADCRRLYGGGAGGSSLAALGAEMRKAALLLHDCDTERGRLARMAVAVDETVEVLVGHVEAVQEIEANMRLVGLNAAVKCAQLGPRGAALGVIATQLRELTSALVVAARTAILRLEEATTAARAFTAASTGKVATELGRLEAEAMASIGLLETVDGRLADALATLEQDGPAATSLLARASHGLGGHAAIAEAMSDAHIALVELSAMAGPPAAPPNSAPLQPPFAALRRLYSMEGERRLHDRIVGDGLASRSGAPGPADEAVLF